MTAGPFTTIPIQLAGALGISVANAALLLSICILISIALALALIGGRKLDPIIVAVPEIAAMSFLVAIAWLPFWVLMVVAMLVAVLIGGTFADRIPGRG